MSNGRNGSPRCVARRRRYSSNICFQHAACRLAVSVITPSRSSRTASYWSRVIADLLSGCRIDRTPSCLARWLPPVSPRLAVAALLLAKRSVPHLDGGNLTVVAEDAQRAGIEQEVLPGTGGQTDPARRERTQHVAMREQRDVTVDGARPSDYPVCAR